MFYIWNTSLSGNQRTSEQQTRVSGNNIAVIFLLITVIDDAYGIIASAVFVALRLTQYALRSVS